MEGLKFLLSNIALVAVLNKGENHVIKKVYSYRFIMTLLVNK